MKKILLFFVALVATLSMNAQTTEIYKGTTKEATYSGADVTVKFGVDGSEPTLEVYKGDKWQATYTGSEYKVVSKELPPSTGTAKRTGDIDVNWVQLWKDGPKFAEYNVGASSATDYGPYLAWGGSQNKVDDHNTGSSALSGDSDTATKLWGSNWRMPTQTELKGLLDNCEVEWTTVGGLNGRKFTGKDAYSSNSVFLPAASYCKDGSVLSQGDFGYYWSSTPIGGNSAYCLLFYSGYQDVGSGNRVYGYSVRAVVKDPVAVTGVSLNKTTLELGVGASETLTPTFIPADADNKNVSWTSDNESVATVDANGKVTAVAIGEATITVTTEDGNKTATCKVAVSPAGALKGEFSVSATKKVHFSKGNLYWDGDSYEFEENQYAIDTWNAENHVNYFFWSKEESVAGAASYADASAAASDVFFTNATAETAKADFTVSGVTGKFRALSAEEWTYILSNRANAADLLVEDVTVCGVEHCLVIAPDACLNSYVFDKTKKSYDAAAWATAEAAGLVCLPPAGYRDGTDVKSGEGNGFYWSSTTDAADKASNLGFKKSDN